MMHTRPTKGPRRKGLTPTQVIILEAAAAAPSGCVRFGAGDRLGTRVVGKDALDRPIIVAYGHADFFLTSRRLLERANEPHVSRITEAGRSAIASAGGVA